MRGQQRGPEAPRAIWRHHTHSATKSLLHTDYTGTKLSLCSCTVSSLKYSNEKIVHQKTLRNIMLHYNSVTEGECQIPG